MRHLRRPSLLLTALSLGCLACKGQTPPGQPAAGTGEPTAPVTAPVSGQDALLLATVHVALPPEGVTPADLPEPGSRGAALEVRYCTQCHPLPAPTMHGGADWPAVVRRMWLRVERLPANGQIEAAPVGDRIELLKYLTDHALQVSGATLPPGRGRDQFAAACSRCHALPDPHLHGPQDWPAVVLRMERNMERMKVSPVASDDLALLLEYLQGPAAVN